MLGRDSKQSCFVGKKNVERSRHKDSRKVFFSNIRMEQNLTHMFTEICSKGTRIENYLYK